MQATLETLFTPADRPRLIDAAELRTSCRAYAGVPDAADYAALSYAIGRYQLPGVRLALFSVEEGFFTGTLLSTKRITGCRMIAGVIVDEHPQSRLHAGIVGEAFVLEATSRGMGTCWVSGSYKRKELQIPLAPGEAVACVIAVGKPVQPLTAPASRQRKAPEHFCRGNFRSWPEELTDAAALIQIAPSAMNMQPWVLSIGPNSELIVDTADRALLDAGIALCHAELALETPHTWHFASHRAEPVAWAVVK